MTQTVIYLKEQNMYLLITCIKDKVGDLEIITEQQADTLLEMDNVNYYSL